MANPDSFAGDAYSTIVSCRSAGWADRTWPIVGVGGPFEARRVGRRPSGLRHRLPVQIVGPGGTVARIERSRGLKGSAARYRVVDGSGALAGAFVAGAQFFGPGDPHLVDADGARLGSLDATGESPGYGDGDGSLADVVISLPSVASAHPGRWSVEGLGRLDPHRRLLVVAHVLVIEPWRRGESAAAMRSAEQARYLNRP